VFVLDMGEQIHVATMARNMILLSGHRPGHDIKIEYTGLRPGEKMYEELFDDTERVEGTMHQKIKRAIGRETFSAEIFSRYLTDLQNLCESGQAEEMVVEKLREIVTNYQPAYSNGP